MVEGKGGAKVRQFNQKINQNILTVGTWFASLVYPTARAKTTGHQQPAT